MKINATLIQMTNFGENKVAFWGNPRETGTPEVYIFNIETKDEEQKSLNCFNNDPS